MDEIEDSTLGENELTFEIGRLVRRAVELDGWLNGLWKLLAGPVAGAALPRGTRDVIDGIVKMLGQVEIEEDLRALCVEAVKDAGRAVERRGQLIHERWVRASGLEDIGWTATISNKNRAHPLWSLDDFRAATEQLDRAAFKLLAIESVVAPNTPLTPFGEDFLVSLLKGKFQLDGRGQIASLSWPDA